MFLFLIPILFVFYRLVYIIESARGIEVNENTKEIIKESLKIFKLVLYY